MTFRFDFSHVYLNNFVQSPLHGSPIIIPIKVMDRFFTGVKKAATLVFT
jgi:hypothetical protein